MAGRREVDDREPPMAQCDAARCIHPAPFVIRAPMATARACASTVAVKRSAGHEGLESAKPVIPHMTYRFALAFSDPRPACRRLLFVLPRGVAGVFRRALRIAPRCCRSSNVPRCAFAPPRRAHAGGHGQQTRALRSPLPELPHFVTKGGAQSCAQVAQVSEGPHRPSPHTQLQGAEPPVQLQAPA